MLPILFTFALLYFTLQSRDEGQGREKVPAFWGDKREFLEIVTVQIYHKFWCTYRGARHLPSAVIGFSCFLRILCRRNSYRYVKKY